MHISTCTFLNLLILLAKKRTLFIWLNKEHIIHGHQTYNPADKLGKFDLNKDISDLWVKHTKAIINPLWLQLPRILFFPDLLKKSKSAIKKYRAEVSLINIYLEFGEPEEDTLREDNISQGNHCDSNNLCTPTVMFAQVNDKLLSQPTKDAKNWSHLLSALDNHKDSKTKEPLKIGIHNLYGS